MMFQINEETIIILIIKLYFGIMLILHKTLSQDVNILLKQGKVGGLKIFPETSRTPVYTYLGIPYAQPPIGKLRFSPPIPHMGWNRTLFARDFQPICPQIDNNIYEEMDNHLSTNDNGNNNINNNGYNKGKTNEDCLYLNIWTSEMTLRTARMTNFNNNQKNVNKYQPVLVIITGEEMAFDWTITRPTGLDLASEGIVVVTIQSRTNIFGWLSLRNVDAPGNLALLDQSLAIKWIEENIVNFGGDPKQITLLGHGTSGATNAILHLLNSNTNIYLSKLILMSGTIFSSYSFQSEQTMGTYYQNPSKLIIKNLVCESINPKFTLQCLQQKSIQDLLKSFENVYKNGNYTNLLGPQIDDYLPKEKRYISDDPKQLIKLKQYPNIPIIMGICNNEGAFIQEKWLKLAGESYETLKNYINSTILPNILYHYGFRSGNGQNEVIETINWRFFDQQPNTDIIHLLNAMQRLISETKYEAPFFETIEQILMLNDNNDNNNNTFNNFNNSNHSNNNNDNEIKPNLYIYSLQHSNSMDLRGHINYFGGSSHSSDLPFLMGPSLFQQIARRRLSPTEERLCKKIRQLFLDFIKTGNPTPGRIYDAWKPFTKYHKFIQILGGLSSSLSSAPSTSSLSPSSSATISIGNMNLFNIDHNKIHIEKLLNSRNVNSQTKKLDGVIVTDNNNNNNNNNNNVYGNKYGRLTTNPYDIGLYSNRKIDNINNNHNNNNNNNNNKMYLADEHKDSDYYKSLKMIHTFWTELLPKIYNTNNNLNEIYATTDNENLLYDNEAIKYKHAFFSMLVLVCLLLAVLGICVYLLKKNNTTFNTSFL